MTHYYLTLNGIDWKEINKKQAQALSFLIVAKIPEMAWIGHRTWELDACLADSTPITCPKLRAIYHKE